MQRAERLGLDPVIRTSHGDVAAGTVFDQHPAPGNILANGDRLTLSISLGPVQVPVTPPKPKPPKHEPPGHDHHHKGHD